MLFKHKIYETVRNPNPKLEPFILENPKYSYEYSKNVLKKRWKKCEPTLLGTVTETETKYICLYAKNVLKKRWKLGEKKIIQICEDIYFGDKTWKKNYFDPSVLVFYAKYVVKGRWKEIEKYIIKTNQIINYISILKSEDEIKEFKRAVKLNGFNNQENFSKNFFSWKPTHKVKIKGKKAFEAMLFKSKKQLEELINTYYIRDFKPSEEIYLVFQPHEWLSFAKEQLVDKHLVPYFLYSVTREGRKVLYKGKNRRKLHAGLVEINPLNPCGETA